MKQSKFGNNLQGVLSNIHLTSDWLLGKVALELKPFEVTPQQYNVLGVLADKCPEVMTMGAIKKEMTGKMPDLTRLVGRLVEKGVAERKTSMANRRSVEVAITAKGLKLVEEVAPVLDGMFVREVGLSEGEVEVLGRLLEKLRK